MTALKSGVRFIPILVALGFVVLGVSFDRFRLPGREYYGTAAQIIPVLIVALAVELREEARPYASTLSGRSPSPFSSEANWPRCLVRPARCGKRGRARRGGCGRSG